MSISGLQVGSPTDLYYLSLGRFIEGTAKDSLMVHNGLPFSAYDRDQDAMPGVNCAERVQGCVSSHEYRNLRTI